MSSNRLVHGEPLKPDDCWLQECVETERKITGLVVIVEVQGYSCQFHPACALVLKKDMRREEIRDQNRARARWN